MNVFYFASENSGVAYYRFYQPLINLKKRKLINLKSWGFDFTDKRYENPTVKEIKETIDWADVIVVGRRDMPDWLNMIKVIKEVGRKKVLLDIDDNVFNISPYLVARQGYHPDGQAMKIHEETARYVDGIIVSTPELEQLYTKYNKVYIINNGIEATFPKIKHDGVNIGYLCSASHLENAQIIEGAIINVLKKYSNVRFFYSRSFQGFLDLVPEELKVQINYLPFYPLKEYLKYVSQLKLDIGIAPLMDNEFNRCKSNIRILEYWQNGIAVIASDVGEYNKTITNGFDGYLVKNDEWEETLDDLVQHPEKRKYFIKNSEETLKKYNISIFADKYFDVLREIVNGKED